MALEPITCLTNCHLCVNGELLPQDLYFSPTTGLITPNYYYRSENVTRLDLGGRVVAPGFLDLQVNGAGGVHFTRLAEEAEAEAERKLERVARMQVGHGVTGWWGTVPTVEKGVWREVLPHLRPRSFKGGADLLGAHVEGPYLHPSKKGAHNDAFFFQPDDITPEELYGTSSLENNIKMVTLAPELPGSLTLIRKLDESYPHITIAMGHSAATYDEGLMAVRMGASMVTHTFNAMDAMKHREPGLPGLMSSGLCWYSVIADGVHLHPAVLKMCVRQGVSEGRCILITDAIELAGCDDGTYEGNRQIRCRQRKVGKRVTMVKERGEGGEETLIGSCVMIDECVRTVVEGGGVTLAEAVKCVTENVADLMGESRRGRLEVGKRADFVVMDMDGGVEETWVEGKKVSERGRGHLAQVG